MGSTRAAGECWGRCEGAHGSSGRHLGRSGPEPCGGVAWAGTESAEVVMTLACPTGLRVGRECWVRRRW